MSLSRRLCHWDWFRRITRPPGNSCAEGQTGSFQSALACQVQGSCARGEGEVVLRLNLPYSPGGAEPRDVGVSGLLSWWLCSSHGLLTTDTLLVLLHMTCQAPSRHTQYVRSSHPFEADTPFSDEETEAQSVIKQHTQTTDISQWQLGFARVGSRPLPSAASFPKQFKYRPRGGS